MTGTELLVAVMERFAQHGDAVDALVIYTDVNGKVRLKSNCAPTRALGLAAYAMADIQDLLRTSLVEEGDDT